MQGSLLDSLASRLCQSDMKKDVLLMFEVGLGGPEIAAAAGPAKKNPRVFAGPVLLGFRALWSSSAASGLLDVPPA